MAASPRRSRSQLLLLLAVFAVAALVPLAAAQKNNGTPGKLTSKAPAPEGVQEETAKGNGAPPPPKRKGGRRRPPPPLAESPARAPAAIIDTPAPSPRPDTIPTPSPEPSLPAPVPSPSPAPGPTAAPSPPAAVVVPENTMKLILKIVGAAYPLSDSQLEAVMWSINNYTIPVEFAWRWQQASAPDTPPQVENAVTVFPPPPPAEEKPPKENTKALTDDSAGSPTDSGNDDEEDNQDGEEKKHRKRRPPPPPEGGERRLRRLLMTASRRLQQAEGATSATQWWPSQEIPMPLNADGVYVFADAQATAVQQPAVQKNLADATTQGLVCTNLKANGVTCTEAVVAAQGTGVSPIVISAGATTGTSTATTTDSSLSTAALVGICIGLGVAALIVVMLTCMFVSWRRERRITRAASLRTNSRRQDMVPDEESKWRQMYSARMAESIRRTEEATSRQQAQSRGPSFVEAQDQAFAAQAAASDRQLTPQMSSKYSFGRGTPQTPATELSSAAKFERESPDHSLMTGSEMSSPAPTMASSGKKRSLKKLFGGGGK